MPRDRGRFHLGAQLSRHGLHPKALDIVGVLTSNSRLEPLELCRDVPGWQARDRRRPLPAEVSRERFVERGSEVVGAVEREAAEA